MTRRGEPRHILFVENIMADERSGYKKDKQKHDQRRTEEKERFEERKDRSMTTAAVQDVNALHSRMVTESPENRYSVVMQAAERRVMESVKKLETRLEKREMDATNRLMATSAKRPGRVMQFLTCGKATKAWHTAMMKQTKDLNRIRIRKSTVHSLRTKASSVQRTLREWIRARALRIDKDVVREHETEMERSREAAERERKERGVSLAKEMERGHERGAGLERRFGPIP